MRYAILNPDGTLHNIVEVEQGSSPYIPPKTMTMREATLQDETDFPAAMARAAAATEPPQE